MDKELTADGCLGKFMENPSVQAYVIFSADGIPVRYDGQGMSHELAVQYAALLTNYIFIVKKTLQKNMKDFFPPKPAGPTPAGSETEPEYITMRTAQNTELIITFYMEYTMMVIQNMNLKEAKKSVPEAEKAIKQAVTEDVTAA